MNSNEWLRLSLSMHRHAVSALGLSQCWRALGRLDLEHSELGRSIACAQISRRFCRNARDAREQEQQLDAERLALTLPLTENDYAHVVQDFLARMGRPGRTA